MIQPSTSLAKFDINMGQIPVRKKPCARKKKSHNGIPVSHVPVYRYAKFTDTAQLSARPARKVKRPRARAYTATGQDHTGLLVRAHAGISRNLCADDR